MRRLVALLPVLIAFQAGAPPALAWTWPADGPVLRAFVLGGDPYASGQHRGVDIAAPGGAAVHSPAAGVVSFAGTVPGGGRTVTVQTADGYSVTLVHLGSYEVAREAPVAEGAPLGTVGPSGDAEHAEPYVHLGIRVTSDPNGYVDPLSLLPERAAAPPPPPAPPAVPAPAQPVPPVEVPQTPAPAPEAPAPAPDAPKALHPVKPRDVPVGAPPVAAGRRAAEKDGEARPSAPVSEDADVSGRAPSVPALPARTVLRSFEVPLAVAVETAGARGVEPTASDAAPSSWADGAAAAAGAAALIALAAGLLVARRRQLGEARPADALALVLHDRAGRSAEDTGAPGSAEKNGLVLDRDLERVALGQPESLADLDWDDDSTELIEVPNDPCSRLRAVAAPGRFHRVGPRPPSRCRRVEMSSAR